VVNPVVNARPPAAGAAHQFSGDPRQSAQWLAVVLRRAAATDHPLIFNHFLNILIISFLKKLIF
jgi:hypothetical protein